MSYAEQLFWGTKAPYSRHTPFQKINVFQNSWNTDSWLCYPPALSASPALAFSSSTKWRVEYVFKNSSHALSFLFTENTARVYSSIPCFMLAAGGSCELGRVHPSVEGYRINMDRTSHRGKAPHPAWGFVYDCMSPPNFLSSITHHPPGLHGSLT